MDRRFAHLIAVEALVTVACSLAGVFSIVYLISLSFSILEASVLYLVAFGVATALCLLARRTGFGRPRRWMALGMLSISAFYLSFVLLDGYALLFLAPLFFGPYIVGFWVPYNVLMLRLTKRENRGELIGKFFLVFPLISLLSPVTGGFLIVHLGYDVVFAAAFVALLSNAILILKTPATVSKPMRGRFRLRDVGPRISLGLFLEGGQEGIWFTANPLLALLFVTDELYLGLLFSVFGLAGGIATVIIGRLSDRKGNRVMYLRAGALAISPVIVVAALSPDVVTYVVMLCVVNLLLPLIPILLFAQAADNLANRKTSLSLTRELLLNSGRVLGGALCLLAILFTSDVRLAYAVMGLMTLGIVLSK